MLSSGRGPACIAALLVAVLAVLPSCSGDSETPKTGSPTPAAGVKVSKNCPYTGRKRPPGIDLLRPAIAVKIENSPQARPQRGLDHADVVFEEPVEGGITRFAAIFHCDSSKRVGPVRSARADDPAFIKPLTRGLAFAGANATVTKHLTEHKMTLFTDANDANALYRVPPGNTSEHSLFANVKLLLKQAASKHVPPPDPGLFRFGPTAAQPRIVKRVDLMFAKTSVSEPIRWRWQGGIWRRYESGKPFMSANGKQISTPNLLIQEVAVKLSKTLVDVAGNPSPRITLTGEGRVFLFRDGGLVRGRWKRSRDGSFKYLDLEGNRLTFARGPIWIELLPSRKGPVKGTLKF